MLGLLEDTSSEQTIDPWDLFDMNGWDWILNPLSAINIGLGGDLTPKVKTTADGKCEGTSTPKIENETHTLLGNTGGGVDITIWKVGYRLTYDVKINSTTTDEKTETEGDCTTLTKTYTHDLMVDFDYIFFFNRRGTIDVGDVTTTLSQECCCPPKK